MDVDYSVEGKAFDLLLPTSLPQLFLLQRLCTILTLRVIS